MEPEQARAATQRWVEEVVVKYNFCPFARAEVTKHAIRYEVCGAVEIEDILLALSAEFDLLNKDSSISTTMLILPQAAAEFESFLDLVDLAQKLLEIEGYEGIYQLATFHPLYLFAGEPITDASHYTNRAPFPTLHLLREAQLEKAIKHYPEVEEIPDRNIILTRRKGVGFWKKIGEKLTSE